MNAIEVEKELEELKVKKIIVKMVMMEAMEIFVQTVLKANVKMKNLEMRMDEVVLEILRYG